MIIFIFIAFLFLSLNSLAYCVDVGQIIQAAGTGVQAYNGDGIPATSANMGPTFVFMDVTNNLYIVDGSNIRVRKVSRSTGLISTVAGTGTQGYNGENIPATSATFYSLGGIFVDKSNNIFIPDSGNQRIRKVSGSTGIITSIAGNGFPGYYGDNVPATTATLYYPGAVSLDAANNIFIADTNNNVIRKVVSSTGIITTIAGKPSTAGYSGDNGPATSAMLNYPTCIFIDTPGNIFISDSGNNRIRKITVNTGIITTVVGTGDGGYNGDNLPATSAWLNSQRAIYVDSYKNIFIADMFNQRIRKVASSTGIITTISGTGSFGSNGNDNAASSATLTYPSGLSLDGFGNIFLSELYGYSVREIVPFPTSQPSRQPSSQPTSQPRGRPSSQPSSQPVTRPSSHPSPQPSHGPIGPTSLPTSQPSRQPTRQPSSQPIMHPSTQPTCRPTIAPSVVPSSQPTTFPTYKYNEKVIQQVSLPTSSSNMYTASHTFSNLGSSRGGVSGLYYLTVDIYLSGFIYGGLDPNFNTYIAFGGSKRSLPTLVDYNSPLLPGNCYCNPPYFELIDQTTKLNCGGYHRCFTNVPVSNYVSGDDGGSLTVVTVNAQPIPNVACPLQGSSVVVNYTLSLGFTVPTFHPTVMPTTFAMSTGTNNKFTIALSGSWSLYVITFAFLLYASFGVLILRIREQSFGSLVLVVPLPFWLTILRIALMGMNIGSETVLIIKLFSKDYLGLAVVILVVRLLQILPCGYIQCALVQNKYMKHLVRNQLVENSYYYGIIYFLSFVQIPMLRYLPWKNTAFSRRSGDGYPDSYLFKLCSYYEIFQLVVTSICQIIYTKKLTISELLKFDNIYIYFSIISSFLIILVQFFELVTRSHVVVAESADSSKSLKFSLKHREDENFDISLKDSRISNMIELSSINTAFSTKQSKYEAMSQSELEHTLTDFVSKLDLNDENFEHYQSQIYAITEVLADRVYSKNHVGLSVDKLKFVEQAFEQSIGFIPVSIFGAQFSDLIEIGMSFEIAHRVISSPCLWLLRVKAAHLAQILSDTNIVGMFGVSILSKLDIIELGALFYLVNMSTIQSNRQSKKSLMHLQKWKLSIESTFDSMYRMLEAGELPEQQQRHPAYLAIDMFGMSNTAISASSKPFWACDTSTFLSVKDICDQVTDKYRIEIDECIDKILIQTEPKEANFAFALAEIESLLIKFHKQLVSWLPKKLFRKVFVEVLQAVEEKVPALRLYYENQSNSKTANNSGGFRGRLQDSMLKLTKNIQTLKYCEDFSLNFANSEF